MKFLMVIFIDEVFNFLIDMNHVDLCAIFLILYYSCLNLSKDIYLINSSFIIFIFTKFLLSVDTIFLKEYLYLRSDFINFISFFIKI